MKLFILLNKLFGVIKFSVFSDLWKSFEDFEEFGSGGFMDRMYNGGGDMGYGYENGVVMTRDPKPRLRWTADLHDRFVDAVTKLGGPDSELLVFLLHLVLLFVIVK